MTFNILQKVKRLPAKQQHRIFQMAQPDIDLRRFAHFTAQSLKFEELEKREKNPIRREYYHKLNRLKQERAMMYCKRFCNKLNGGIGTPTPNTGEKVITKEKATKLIQAFDTRPATHLGELSADNIKEQMQQPSKPLQQ